MQLRREPDLRVHHAVSREVLGALGGHPHQRVAGLHHPDRVLERLEVQLKVAVLGGSGADPAAQLGRVGRRQAAVAGLLGELDDRRRPQPAVQVVVQQHLGYPADLIKRRRHAVHSRLCDALDDGSGRSPARSAPISMPPSSASSAPVEPRGLVGPQLKQRLPVLDPLPRLGQADHAGARADRVFLAGPAGPEPPRRGADRERVELAAASRTAGRHDLDVRARPAASRQDRRPARRSSPGTWPAPGHRPAPPRDRPRSRPAPASPAPAPA